MKAAIVTEPGAAASYGDFDDPVAAEGRTVVELVASGLHRITRSLADGRHYGSTGVWPLIPGVDAVARTADGTLVYTGYPEPPYGTLAERMSVPDGFQLPLPPGSDPVAIAAGLNPGMASWLPLTARAREAGALGTVLVLGVTGLAGLLAVQNALLLGATAVIGAGRSHAGLQRAAASGAVTAALTGDKDEDARSLAAALDGHGTPSLVLDFLWAGPAEAAFAALSRPGLAEDTADISYQSIGSMAGPEAAVPSALLRSRAIHIAGSGAGSAAVADVLAQLPRYMELIAGGRIEIPTRTYRLSRVEKAWTAASHGATRTVIIPG